VQGLFAAALRGARAAAPTTPAAFNAAVSAGALLWAAELRDLGAALQALRLAPDPGTCRDVRAALGMALEGLKPGLEAEAAAARGAAGAAKAPKGKRARKQSPWATQQQQQRRRQQQQGDIEAGAQRDHTRAAFKGLSRALEAWVGLAAVAKARSELVAAASGPEEEAARKLRELQEVEAAAWGEPAVEYLNGALQGKGLQLVRCAGGEPGWRLGWIGGEEEAVGGGRLQVEGGGDGGEDEEDGTWLQIPGRSGYEGAGAGGAGGAWGAAQRLGPDDDVIDVLLDDLGPAE
jgi:hypothetical protein